MTTGNRKAPGRATEGDSKSIDLYSQDTGSAAYWHGYLDGRAHGVEVGYDRGFSARVELEAEARARELLTEQADQFGAWAVREAGKRHGAAWASMFQEAS